MPDYPAHRVSMAIDAGQWWDVVCVCGHRSQSLGLEVAIDKQASHVANERLAADIAAQDELSKVPRL